MYPVQYLNVYLGYHITSYLCKRGSSTAIKVYTKHGKHQFLYKKPRPFEQYQNTRQQ